MAKKVYWNGKLIPIKDWDYETKRPKIKSEKKAVVAEPESQVEVIAVEELEFPTE